MKKYALLVLLWYAFLVLLWLSCAGHSAPSTADAGPKLGASGGNYAIGLVPGTTIEGGVWTGSAGTPNGQWAAPPAGGGGDGGAISNSLVGQIEDQNSTIWGDITQGEWTALELANAPTIQPNAGTTTDGYLDAVIVNPSAGSGLYYLESYFTPPPNTTAMSFEVDHLENGSSCSFNAAITDVTGGTNIAIATCTTGASWATCTTGSASLTAGTVYRARIAIPSNSCTAFIGKVRTRVLTTTNPLFTSAYTRYNASSGLLWDNAHADLVFNASIPLPYRYQSALSRFVFDTNAPILGVNILNQLGSATTSPYWDTLVSVNGRPYALLAGALGAPDVQNVTLPAGLNRVEVTTSVSVYVSPTVPINYHPYGQYSVQATTLGVIVPQGSTFNVVPPPRPQSRIVIFGDSKDTGFYAGNPTVQGWPALLRRSFPSTSFMVESVSGLSMYAIAQTPAIRQASIATLAQTQPTALLFALGRNDWFGAGEGLQSAANYQTMLGAWLDGFHAASPMTSVWAMSTTLESTASEAATNVFGSLLSAYRTAMSNACTARAGWCNFIDGTTVTGWSQTASLADGLHPNAIGSYQIASWLGPQLVPQPQNGIYWAAPNQSIGDLAWPNTFGAPTLSQEATDSGAPNPIILQPQASTNANGDGGAVLISLPSSSGSGAESQVEVTRGGAQIFNVQDLQGASGGYTVAYLGPNTGANFALIADTAGTFTGIGAPAKMFFGIAETQHAGMTASGFQFFNAGVPDVGGGVDVLGIGATTTLPSTSLSAGDSVIASDTGGIHLSNGANLNFMQFGSVTGNGTIWLNVTPSGLSNAGLYGNSSYTTLNHPTTVSISAGAQTSLLGVAGGDELFSSTADLGGGVGVLGIAQANTAPTFPPTGGDSVIFSEPSGLYYDGPTVTTSQIQWQLAPTIGGPLQAGQGGTFAINGNFLRTASTTGTIVTIPVPTTMCVAIEAHIVGRKVSAGNSGTMIQESNVFCNSAGTVSQGTAVTIATPGIGCGGCSAGFSVSGTNALVTVTMDTQTNDWTGYAFVTYN